MGRRSRRGIASLVSLLTPVAFVATSVTPAAASAAFSVSLATSGTIGTMYLDAITNGVGGGGAYDGGYSWRANGQFWNMGSGGEETSLATTLTAPGAPTLLRLELYPKPDASNYSKAYDPWSGNSGGIHVQRERALDGAGWLNFGQLTLPTVGQGDAFRIEGDIYSSTAIADGRLSVDMFQIMCPPAVPCGPLHVSTSGALYGAFASGKSKGAHWTGSVGWPGYYMVWIKDSATGRNIQGFMNITAGHVPVLDLDTACFGLDTCVYESGQPAVPKGGFHPVSPTRILDTRSAVGITNGAIRSGDGRSSSKYPAVRRDEALNHDLTVTGVGGIPAGGVSAVLLNVTAVGPPSGGYVSVYPRPIAIGDSFNDQATYRTPSTSNLNLAQGETVPNLVVARVGAGGKIRLQYFGFGQVAMIADVAGWFDTGSSVTSPGGLGFTGLAPQRLVDTRLGTGDPLGRYAADDDRAVDIAGVGGVPSDADAVVLNVTSVSAGGDGFVTVYPDGEARPNASNLNLDTGRTRSNLVVVKLGVSGRVRVASMHADTDLIVDVFGYYSGSGGATTAIDPVRVMDSRTGQGTAARRFGPQETRTLTIAGVAGIPINAKAVLLNVTSVDSTDAGWLTVWPAGLDQPNSSNLNWSAGQTVPNMVMVQLGTGGAVSLYNDSGAVHILVDVFAYVT